MEGPDPDENFRDEPQHLPYNDDEVDQFYSSIKPAAANDYERPLSPPPAFLHEHAATATDKYVNAGTSSPDDFYKGHQDNPAPRGLGGAGHSNRMTESKLETPYLRSKGDGTTAKLPTIPAQRNVLPSSYRSSSAPIDRMPLNAAKSSPALNGLPKAQQPNVKELLKRFDTNSDNLQARKPHVPTWKAPSSVNPRSRTPVESHNPSTYRAGQSTREGKAGSPTLRATQRIRFVAEDQHSNNTLSSAARFTRPRNDVPREAQPSNFAPTLLPKLESPTTARKPLFGEVIQDPSSLANLGYGISHDRPRRTSESSIHRPLSHIDRDSSPTDWYRAATSDDLDLSSTPGFSMHVRSQSDHSGSRNSSGQSPTPSKTPIPISVKLPQSRLPISSRKPSLTGPVSPSSNISNIKVRKQASRPWTPAGRSTTPTNRPSSRQKASPGRVVSGSSLNALISSPPPKTSPPLRSSRPRQPVSTATTASSRGKAIDRTGSPQTRSGRTSRAGSADGSRHIGATAPDFAPLRARIRQNYTKTIHETEIREMQEAELRRQGEEAAAKAEQAAAKAEDLHDHPEDITEPKLVVDTSFLLPAKLDSGQLQMDSPTLGIPGGFTASPPAMPGSFPASSPAQYDETDFDDVPSSAISAVTEFDNEPQTEAPRINSAVIQSSLRDDSDEYDEDLELSKNNESIQIMLDEESQPNHVNLPQDSTPSYLYNSPSSSIKNPIGADHTDTTSHIIRYIGQNGTESPLQRLTKRYGETPWTISRQQQQQVATSFTSQQQTNYQRLTASVQTPETAFDTSSPSVQPIGPETTSVETADSPDGLGLDLFGGARVDEPLHLRVARPNSGHSIWTANTARTSQDSPSRNVLSYVPPHPTSRPPPPPPPTTTSPDTTPPPAVPPKPAYYNMGALFESPPIIASQVMTTHSYLHPLINSPEYAQSLAASFVTGPPSATLLLDEQRPGELRKNGFYLGRLSPSFNEDQVMDVSYPFEGMDPKDNSIRSSIIAPSVSPHHSPPLQDEPTQNSSNTPFPNFEDRHTLSFNQQSSQTTDSRRPSADEMTSSQQSISTPRSSTQLSLNGDGQTSKTRLSEPEQEIIRKLQQRKNIIKEWLDTEAYYLKDMNVVEEIYKGTAEACPKLEPGDIKTIFRNTNEIVSFTAILLQDLKVASLPVYAPRSKQRQKRAEMGAMRPIIPPGDPGDSDWTKDQKTTIGASFGKHFPEMEAVYTEFLKNSEIANNRLVALMGDAAVKVWLGECDLVAKDLTSAWDLNALLVKPVQRVTKYQMLLGELLKCTPDEHPDFAALKESHRGIVELLVGINDLKKRLDDFNKIIGRKRKESEVKMGRLGLRNILGARREKVAEIGRQEDDPVFAELFKKFSVNYISLQVTLRDIEHYTRLVGQWVVDFLRFLTAQELTVRFTPSSYPELESKWGGYSLSMRDMEKIALADHIADIRKRVIEPLEQVIKLHGPPELAMKRRNKRRLDYEKAVTLKSQKKKVDEKLAEMVEQYEALNETLKFELPKLEALTKQVANICLIQFVSILTSWYALWQEKAKTVLEVRDMPIDMEDIIEKFYRDFRFQNARAMEFSIINGTFLEDCADDEAMILSRRSRDSVPKPRVRPPTSGSRPRGQSAHSDSSPSLPTPDLGDQGSGRFLFSPLTASTPGLLSASSRESSGHAPGFSAAPDSFRLSLNRPSTGRSFESGVPTRSSVDSNNDMLQTPLGSRFDNTDHINAYLENLPYSRSAQRPFSGIFNSALPTPDEASENEMSSRASSQDRGRSNGYNVMYLAASLFEFNINATKTEAGYKYLTYQAGEIFDVIAEKGELWLAKNQDDPSDHVGWIWSKHFARLATD